MGPPLDDVVAGMPSALIHAQKPLPPSLLDDEARFEITSHPPLTQVTKTPATPGQVDFVVGLQVHQSRAHDKWQVAVSTSALHSSAWTDFVLASNSAEDAPIYLQASHDKSVLKLHFTASIPVESAIRFTLKFRESPDKPWRLVRDELQLDDGIIVPDHPDSLPDDIHDVIECLSRHVTIRQAVSQSPATCLWQLDAPIAGVGKNDQSAFSEVELGLPWGRHLLRWFALARTWAPWIGPCHGKTRFDLDKDSVLCSFLNDQGKHCVLLAVTGTDHVLTGLRSNDAGKVVLRMRSDNVAETTAKVIVAVGETFDNASAACVYHARGLLQLDEQQKSSPEGPKQIENLAAEVQPEWMENWYDGLGYCTWNALGQRLSEEKVLDALNTLADNEIMITNLIIDDNWQDISRTGDGQFQYGWNGFEAEPDAFPYGLKATVSSIRAKHKHVQHVAVWHALLGYWGGITPGGPIANSYKTIEVVREEAKRRGFPLGGPMTVVAKEDVNRFYDDFYRFLASSGVDGVKTDAQFVIDMWTGASARRELSNAYLDAWTIASLRHFSNRAISCMSMTPHIMFHSQLPRKRPAIPLRNSDDFTPAIPASHPWHVWTNAHNGLLTQYFNIVPDWDMFQTSHDYSGFHAAARCVSGGPIYITDVPGEHDKALISEMTGTTPRGKTVIFRTSAHGKSIDQYVGYTDDALLKVGTYHGGANSGTSMLGVFNVALRPLTDMIPLDRFPGTRPQITYVVRSHRSGRVSPPIQPGTRESVLAVSLEVRGYDILSAFPLSRFTSRSGVDVQVANLGLLGKMAGAAAVVSSDVQQAEGSGRVLVHTRVKALGVLGIYVSHLPSMSITRDMFATLHGSAMPEETVSVSSQDDRVLAVDLEAAWKSMGLKAGYSNEVELKFYIGLGNIDSESI
ncbi:uncharacterized protein PpBr36_05728 [Pyricularia pennisetigena]|uniref:uncharacterized protein n=1 Tax=Pyricularia pennisetigena TaxID=1578925 RepID=UPI0011535EEA|nr:uncharacterized protein PpBr36_05728 [Pyricularia pennisetigena]TLS23209.1 hypothetical protein PpBr36_05728 [Pyricularia pennisetigena]